MRERIRRITELFAKLLAITIVASLVPLAFPGVALAARVKTIKITDASVVEGDSGSKTMTFKVSWSGSKGGGSVSVHYSTANITATAGKDYTATSGTASMSGGGCHCASISVPILGDKTTEGTETFQVNLSNPVSGVIGDGQGIGTIYDNEGPPSLVVADTAVAESAGTLSFSVLLTNPSASVVAVDYATADGTALAGSDYTATSNSLTFSPGQTSKTVPVPVTNDSLNEDDETFTLNLTNASGAGIVDAQGVGTIQDDDPEPDLSIGNAAVTEGDVGTTTATFTLTLSTASGREVDVDYATADATASAGADYQAASGTVAFSPGETTKQIAVTVDGDAVYEGNETFTVGLAAPVNANIVGGSGLGTIADDDAGPKLSVDDPAVAEGGSGTSILTFTVTMDPSSASAVTVDYATADGTATAGLDYTATSGTLTLAPGETTKTVAVDVAGDSTYEPDETVTLTLSNPAGGGSKIVDAQGTGTIQNDDKAPTSLTLRLVKTRTSIRAKGTIQVALPGMAVRVTLYKKKGGRFVKIAGKTVAVGALMDRNADGLTDGAYAAAFKRPAAGTYRLKASYAGSPIALACVKSLKSRL